MANLIFDFLHNYVTGERRASDPADAYQYDEGHVLEAVVPVAVTSCEIQYWIRGMEKADAYTPTSITQNTDNTYTILGNIPNSYFETYGDLRVYIVVTDGDASITTYEGYIHIKERQMPEDYVDDDPDNEAVRVIAEAQAAAATATQKAGEAAESAEQAQEILDSIPEDYSQLSEDVSNLKDDLTQVTDYINGISAIDFTVIPDEYVKQNGDIDAFNGWDRTDYIPVTAGEVIYYTWTTTSAYNCFYDANKNKIGSNIFMVDGEDRPLTIIDGASYVMFSNTRAGIASLELYRTVKKEDAPEIIMIDKIVALQNEQFDVHYDNVLANNTADDMPYKEAFGSFSGVSMEDFMRIQNADIGTSVGTICFGNQVPSAFNYNYLPANVIRKTFNINTISTAAGSGVSKKVLLIGDSWTAPGKYARELQALFASADEPMNITLLGTLGNGGAYVGPENGYHEGHGGYSAKIYCTESTYNTYANAFYNQTSNTFDFSYYMTNCGFSSVDDVFINLGINDVATMQDYDEILSYWDIMVNSIKSYNSGIRVFIGLCGLPAQYKYSVTNNNCNREKARRLFFHKKLFERYGSRENEGIIIVPLHLSIDSKHDFPSEQRARSYRDSTLVEYCTDVVHPNDIAYNKIADRIRTYIKYAETI